MFEKRESSALAGVPLEGLRRTKRLARLALGVVWLWEGFVNKLLIVNADELAVVAASGLYWPTPEEALAALGVLETAAGLVVLSGYRERLAALLTTLGMLAITAIVVATEPVLLLQALGGIPKNGALVACAYAIWVLSPLTSSSQEVHHAFHA